MAPAQTTVRASGLGQGAMPAAACAPRAQNWLPGSRLVSVPRVRGWRLPVARAGSTATKEEMVSMYRETSSRPE